MGTFGRFLILVFFFDSHVPHFKFKSAEVGDGEGNVGHVGMAGTFDGCETLGLVLCLSSIRHY